MLPGSRHALPLSQRPNSCAGDDFAHVTGPFTGGGAPDHPQQSLSLRQISPVGAQPEGGWQTRKPGAAPVGAHTREQHVPPQDGRVPVVVPHTVPLTEHCVAPGADTVAPQTPSVTPAGLAQLPPQQSEFCAQTSPACAQNETPDEQSPLLQRPEQQSGSFAHGLPDVLHDVLSGAQTPPLHAPLQHSPSIAHAALSAVHCFVEH